MDLSINEFAELVRELLECHCHCESCKSYSVVPSKGYDKAIEELFKRLK